MNKRFLKKIHLFTLTGLLLLGVTACGRNSSDAAAYVTSVLDANYHQEFHDYAQFCGISEADAQNAHDKKLDTQVENDLTDLGEFTDEERQEYRDMLIAVSKLATYETTEVIEDEDGNFTVTVKITPSNVYQTLQEHVTALAEERKKNGDTITDSSVFQQILVQGMQTSINENEYGEARTIEVTVTKDTDGHYQISDEDLKRISDALFPG